MTRGIVVALLFGLAACASSQDAPTTSNEPVDSCPGTDAGANADAAADADADANANADADADADADANADAAAAACPHHVHCGWLGANDTAGYAAFAANADYFDVIHPDWYVLDSDAQSIKPLTGEGDATVLAAASAHAVDVMPLIYGGDDASLIRAMMNDTAKRDAHVANLVQLVTSKGYAGIDIDYEHMWDGADRAPFTAFAKALGDAMHAAGKVVSMAVPGLDTNATNNAWDFAALAQSIDTLHIMGYDYHGIGSSHGGPTAPLGWIQAIAARAAGIAPDRFVLGVPNYGVTPDYYCALADCPAQCTGSIATSTTEMTTCPFNVDTHYTAGRSMNCAMSSGETLYFDDTQSLEEKVAAAKSAGLRGITYWTVGSEPPGFFAMVAKYYPSSRAACATSDAARR